MADYARIYMLSQFTAILTIGVELQQKDRDWAKIHNALGSLNIRLDSLPWELVTAADINLLLRPCQHIFAQFYSVKEGIPHKFAMSILERTVIFLRRSVESGIEFLQANQRHECFLVSLNVLKKGPMKNLELFSDELLDSSLGLFLLILNKDVSGELSQFGPNMVKGMLLVLNEILNQASRPYAVRVTALLLLERCFQSLVTAEMYPQVVPGILSLTIHVLCRNPDTDSTKVLVQALNLTKTILNLTGIDVASQNQGDWVKSFTKGARAAVKKLDVLLYHNSPLVQHQLLDIYFWAFEDSHSLFDKDFKATLLASLLPLAINSHSQTQEYAFRGLVQAVDSATLAACFNLHHAKLVQVFTSEKEADKVHLMRLLSSAVLALGPAIVSHLPNLSDCWLSWCKILLPEETCEVVEVSETRLTLKESTADARDVHLLCSEIQTLSKEAPLKYIRDRLTFDTLIQFFQYLGFYYGAIDTLLFEATQILSSEKMKSYHSSVLCIIDCILFGRKMNVVPLFEFHKANRACWIQPHDATNIRLTLLPAVIETMDRFDQAEVTSSDLVDFHALHMVAAAAIDHGPNFRLELFSTLYTVIEKVGHQNSSISWAAKHCLKVIELACGYSSLMDLIQDNLDYLIHSVTLRVHPMYIHPPAASMLSALFQLSKGQDLALLDDIFDLVADGLHASSIVNEPSSHTVCLFLEVFANMTMPITRCLIERERYLLADTSPQLRGHPSDLHAFIAEYKQAKYIHEVTLLDETPQDDLSPPQPSDDAVVKRCHGRLKKVLATASCFVSHSNPRCRQLSMQVIATVAQTAADLSIASEIAGEVRQPLDPMWHRVWPGLCAQLDNPNPILCELALTTIAAMQAFSPGFLGPRMATQALPKVLALAKDPSASHSLRLSGLKFLISTIQHLQSNAFDPWDLYDVIQDLCHLQQAGIPEARDLIESELIPSLERNGGIHADLACMLCLPQTKTITS